MKISSNDYEPVVVGELPEQKITRRKYGKWDEAMELAKTAPGQWVLANDDCSISNLYHLRNGKFPATRDIDQKQWQFEKRIDPDVHGPNRCAIYVRLKVAK